ncbi:RNA/RNP complex-1-interacting phosphatase homolog [Haemaphysalis longicornis]
MGRSKTIPDRWLDYTNVGSIVPGTRFIAFKVPLRESICARLPPHQRFTPNALLERVYGLGLVIDLTCTDRYYDPTNIKQCGIVHAKIMCVGQQVPSESVVYQFFQAVDAFLMNPANDGKLIGVHCTHGVNRTGYLVCKYMIDRLRIAPATAIEDFERSRGHRFDREEYVSNLQGGGGDARAPLPVPASRPVAAAAHGGYGDHRGPQPMAYQRDDFRYAAPTGHYGATGYGHVAGRPMEPSAFGGYGGYGDGWRDPAAVMNWPRGEDSDQYAGRVPNGDVHRQYWNR